MNQQIEENKKRRKLMSLLMVLALIMMITSCMVGYILGRSAGISENMGQIIDTIEVTPQPKAKTMHISGQILYSDGTPYANALVQLHSNPRETYTDANGVFLFPNAEMGTHTIKLISEQGKVLTERILHINTTENKENMDATLLDSGAYEVLVSKDITFVEFKIGLDKKTGVLTIDTQQLTYMTEEGKVVTSTGTMDSTKEKVVTASGIIIETNGSIIVPNGTIIDSKGEVNTGEIGTTIKPKPSKPETTNPGPIDPGPIDPGPIDPGPVDPGPIDPGPIDPGPIDPGPVDPGPIDPGPVDPGPIDPGPTDPGGGGGGGDVNEVLFSHGTKPSNMINWTQNAVIDLFYNRTAGIASETLIAPGSEGYYLFRLSNSNSFAIAYELTIAESSYHLPMEFCIADEKGKQLSDWMSADMRTGATTAPITLPKGETATYQIKWRWPYENTPANNAIDTAAAQRKDRIYTIDLSIYAQQQ